jgi:Ca2+-binding EF-hand superfamily protein
MKKNWMIALLMAGCACATVCAQEGRRGGGPRDPREMMRMMPVIAALDADGDGVISAEEINNASVALRKLDKNGDGKLTEEEIRPNFPPGGRGGRGEPGGFGGPSPDEIVKDLLEFDKNGDGQLSKDELPERMQGLFARGDANSDGVLSKDELRKIAEAQSARQPRGERDDHHEGERRPSRPPNQQ